MGSCIRKHILKNAKEANHIVAYSDACGGQNRNFKQCMFWLKLLADTEIKIIDHKFMVSGHSFLPNDRDFGQIEQYAKKIIKYVPEDWYTIIRKCRSRKPFVVYEMQKDDFYGSKSLEDAVIRRKKNKDNAPVAWLKIQWLHFEKNKPYKIFYKETLNEDIPFDVIDLLPNNRKGAPKQFKNIALSPLYESSLPINDKKKKDMEELFQFIPPIHQQYFKDIIADGSVEDIGALEEEDF